MDHSNTPLILQFLRYIASPKVCKNENLTFRRKVFNILRLWSLSFALAVCFALFITICLQSFGYSEESHKLNEFFVEFSPLTLVLIVVFWAPITEEIAFRLWLKYSPLKWGLGLSFLIFGSIIYFSEGFFTFETIQGVGASLLLIFSLFSFIFFILRNSKIDLIAKEFFKKNFRFFFYILAILFAAIHVVNYDVDLKKIWYFAPFLVFPQLFLSFTLSFIRMKYGFVWAVFTHALNNAVSITPILLFSPILEKDLENLDINSLGFYEISIFLAYAFFALLFFSFCLFLIISLFLEFTKGRRK